MHIRPLTVSKHTVVQLPAAAHHTIHDTCMSTLTPHRPSDVPSLYSDTAGMVRYKPLPHIR